MKKLIKQVVGEKNAGRVNKLRNSFINSFKKEAYSILLDITNGCNLKCAFCTRDNDKVVQMTTDEFNTILKKTYKHITSIQLSCAWEYSIAKNAADIIRVIGKYKIPSTTIYTNGNILTNEIMEALIEAQINTFVVSIGEAKKETYEKLRAGGKFERVLSNIGKLATLKKERQIRFPEICANLTLMNSNINELIEFVDLAHSIGVERIIGRHLILNKGLDMKNEIIEKRDYVNNIIDIAQRKAIDYGMSFDIPKYEEQLKPKSCRAPWHQLYISSNGDVSVCPRIHLYDKIGNMLTESFSRVVKGREIEELKKQFNNNEFRNPVCAICMENRETEIAIDQGF